MQASVSVVAVHWERPTQRQPWQVPHSHRLQQQQDNPPRTLLHPSWWRQLEQRQQQEDAVD
jgi:hypothetical protein